MRIDTWRRCRNNGKHYARGGDDRGWAEVTVTREIVQTRRKARLIRCLLGGSGWIGGVDRLVDRRTLADEIDARIERSNKLIRGLSRGAGGGGEQLRSFPSVGIARKNVPIESGFRDDVCRIIANGCISDPHSAPTRVAPWPVALIWRLLYSASRGSVRASITRNNIFL